MYQKIPGGQHTHVEFDDADSDYSSQSQADRGKSLRAIIKKYMLDYQENRHDEISYVRLQQEVNLSEYEKNEYAR